MIFVDDLNRFLNFLLTLLTLSWIWYDEKWVKIDIIPFKTLHSMLNACTVVNLAAIDITLTRQLLWTRQQLTLTGILALTSISLDIYRRLSILGNNMKTWRFNLEIFSSCILIHANFFYSVLYPFETDVWYNTLSISPSYLLFS